jgi:putative ABC transport system permease protein
LQRDGRERGPGVRQATARLLRNGLALTGLGTAIGLAGSVGVTRALLSLLFGVGTADPATFIGVPAVLVGVAWLACYLPMRQARYLDPIKAINAE